MRPIHFVRTVSPLVGGFFLLSMTLVAQTPQQPSIADAARANREQKKTPAQPAKVITNDSLGPSSSASAGSNTPAAQPVQNAASDPSASATDGKSEAATQQTELTPADEQKLKAQVASLKQQLKDEQSEVEVQKRLVELEKDAYFSETDFAHDTQGKARLDAEQDSLKQKEEAFEALKAKLLGLAPQEALAPAPEEKAKH